MSHRNLRALAVLVWYIGGIVLLLKASSLLVEAETLKPGKGWWLAVIAGLFLGAVKGKYLFSRSCQRNLNRIAALDQPRIWQFFRPGFFIFLAAMILVGATLSRLAHGNYPFLISIGILDLSIATALLWSSHIFWTRKAFGE